DLRVLGGKLQRPFGDADATGSHVDAAEFQSARRLVESLALGAADQVVRGNAVVLEYQFSRIDRFVAELFELAADGEAGAGGGDEQAHPPVPRFGARIGLDQQGEDRTLDAVGDPGL